MQRSVLPRRRLATALLCVFILGAIWLLAQASPVLSAPWQETHWLFSYSDGYVKRGLVGTVYQWFERPVLAVHVKTTALTLTVAALAMFGLLLTAVLSKTLPREARASPRSITAATLVAALLVSSPGLVQQRFADVTRFDVFGVLLAQLAFAAVWCLPKSIAFWAVVATSCLSIVVHEAFLCWVPGLCFGMWAARFWHGAKDRWRLGVFVLTAVALGYYTAVSRYANQMEFARAKALLGLRADFPVSDASLMVHYRTLADNLRYASAQSWGMRRHVGLVFALVVLAPQVTLLAWLLRRARETRPHATGALVILALTTLAPLALFALGQDQGRWLAMIGFGFALVIAFLTRLHPECLVRLPAGLALVLALGVALQLASGRFGVTVPFPEARSLDRLSARLERR